MNRLIPFLLLVVATGCAGTQALTVESGPEDVIETMVEAYAARDLDAMMAVFDPNIEWMSVEGDDITMVATGRPPLRSMMAENLAAYPDASWRVESMHRVGAYVTTTEHATWDGGQSSLRNAVVYEVRDGLVKRIWFFPPAE
ncbi:MAG: SnoaL-like domain-containing protein [Rhodothermales bacterium]|nr:SnoaL-like domain-containing protein [Rhodothermales bacterium]